MFFYHLYDFSSEYLQLTLGDVPIIDRNSRRKESIPMAPHEVQWYNERDSVERFNARLKDEFYGRNVIVSKGVK